jgi:SAM-dependent methyltransferase
MAASAIEILLLLILFLICGFVLAFLIANIKQAPRTFDGGGPNDDPNRRFARVDSSPEGSKRLNKLLKKFIGDTPIPPNLFKAGDAAVYEFVAKNRSNDVPEDAAILEKALRELWELTCADRGGGEPPKLSPLAPPENWRLAVLRPGITARELSKAVEAIRPLQLDLRQAAAAAPAAVAADAAAPAAAVAAASQPVANMLDYGCSNGRIGNAIARGLSTAVMAAADPPVWTVRGFGADIFTEEKAVLEAPGYDRGMYMQMREPNHSVIPLPDQSMDMINANMVMHHVAQPKAVLAELWRVLKPNGIVRLTDHDCRYDSKLDGTFPIEPCTFDRAYHCDGSLDWDLIAIEHELYRVAERALESDMRLVSCVSKESWDLAFKTSGFNFIANCKQNYVTQTRAFTFIFQKPDTAQPPAPYTCTGTEPWIGALGIANPADTNAVAAAFGQGRPSSLRLLPPGQGPQPAAGAAAGAPSGAPAGAPSGALSGAAARVPSGAGAYVPPHRRK